MNERKRSSSVIRSTGNTRDTDFFRIYKKIQKRNNYDKTESIYRFSTEIYLIIIVIVFFLSFNSSNAQGNRILSLLT